MKRISILLLLAVSAIAVSQSGAKWATDLNGIGSGDAFGTSNNFPILFHTNNALKMTLNTNGVLNLNAFNGIGNRVLLTDASGNLYALPQGTSSQVLFGDGTWGNLPAGAGSWGVNGNDIFNTNSGKIGIGTNNPVTLLDINGDVHIQNNLYVDGQILITDRLESGTVNTDTLRADTGSVIIDDTRVVNKFEVGGNSKFAGNLNVVQLAGLGDREVIVDASGNLRVGGPITTPGIVCFPNAPAWNFGGNNLGVVIPGITDKSIGSCDLFDFILKANNNPRIWIKSTGKIGFNLSNPDEQFHFNGGNVRIDGTLGTNPAPSLNYSNMSLIVNGDVSLANYFPTGATGNPGNGMNGIEILGNNKQPTRRGISVDADPNGSFNFFINSAQSNSFFKFKNSATIKDLVTIAADGRVWIGDMKQTTGSFTNFKLAVDGIMVAREIVVTQQNWWPDYVFSKNYKLMPLLQVDEFIRKNSHLPNIPSAKEIKDKGLNTGEMLSKHTEKIEEMTLYMIEMKKEIIELRKENNELKNEVKELRKEN